MTYEELKTFFIDRWNSCYAVTHDEFPKSIFLYYDKNITRKIKLCKLNNIEFKTDKITGVCLFELDYKNKNLYCNYNEILSFLLINYSPSYSDNTEFIWSILKEEDKLKKLKPILSSFMSKFVLDKQEKLKVLKPYGQYQTIKKVI